MSDQSEDVQAIINNAKARAYETFLRAMEEFDGHVYELQEMIDENMGADTDKFLVDATAQVNRYNALLAQVTDHHHKRGEYAK